MSCLENLIVDRERPRRSSAFTLTEMLVVMGIIVILMAGLLPAIKGISGGLDRRGTADTLLATLDHARMMAISDGQATYVVFASTSTTLRSELRGHAYAVYEDHDNILFKPEQRTPWMQLPNTLAFKLTPAADAQGNPHNSVMNRPLSQSFPVNAGALPSGTAATSLQLPYWKFDPTGAVDESGDYLRLLIFPGQIDPNTGAELPTVSGGTSNVNLLEEIDVSQATGRAKYNLNPYYNLSTPSPTP